MMPKDQDIGHIFLSFVDYQGQTLAPIVACHDGGIGLFDNPHRASLPAQNTLFLS